MNSYPPELLVQLVPIMFIAGLDVPETPENTTSPTSKPQDPFTVLILRLRDALVAQRKTSIWHPEKSKTFQVIFADKAVKFPPRKLGSPDDPGHSTAHSPLSPLTPSSPLHPDGLIAPIWIRKHTTLLPSVFVLFMRIFEFPAPTGSPLDLPDTERDKEREHDERHHDTELAAEIALRKKETNERGIKLTVVLIASRKMLDDPGLDPRLTFIRRQSGLDSRAALFVLSPVSQAELGEFINSLQQALYDPAVEYYTNHSKRVRRKRNRHTQTSLYQSSLPPGGGVMTSRPLRPEGWTVRYEYKMACFAEFRGEDELALKHYHDAYEMLVIMFGSTAILPPRTKRWAEAKVLADCINVKIVKLYLYNNEHSLALAHHTTHIRKFGDFSRGWGIGEETFEFWSWMARQHRILAELLEQGTRSNLSLPIHLPVVTSSNVNTILANAIPPQFLSGGRLIPANDLESLRSLGINPSHALQHPGFYYYMAAQCTELRRAKFLLALEAEETDQANPSPSPGFTNERKVDHLSIILELYTKAYELFKKHTSSTEQNQPGRLTLWIAYRIALTYAESKKFDMAVRFFERIAKTYQREKWGSMLRPLLSTWYKCAQELADSALVARLLIEMLGSGQEDGEDPERLQNELLALMKTSSPSPTDEPLVIDLMESECMFDASVAFWTSEVKVDEAAVFQLTVKAPRHATISSLPISSLEIQFSNSSGNMYPVVMRHAPAQDGDRPAVRRVDLGEILPERTIETDLRWYPGNTIVFVGRLSSNTPTSLKISQLLATLVEGSWHIQIPFDPCVTRRDVTKWLVSVDPPRFINLAREDLTSVRVRHRPHNVHLSVHQNSPAYLDEEYPISLQVTNLDDRELDVHIDVLLQPTELELAVNSIALDDERSQSLIKGIHLGILTPGATASKTLRLTSTGAPGDRMVDVSIRTRSTSSAIPEESASPIEKELLDVSELLKTIDIPTTEALQVEFDVIYRRAMTERIGLADLRRYEEDFWDDSDGGVAVVTARLKCLGPWSLELQKFSLTRQDNEQARVLYCTADDATLERFSSDYGPGDTLTEMCRITLSPIEEYPRPAITGPGEYVVQWRRILPNGEKAPPCTKVFPLPPLKPPVDEIVAFLDIGPQVKLHEPTNLTLTVRNRQLTRSANVCVQLEPEASDAFVVAGIRSGKLPVLLPGAEHRLAWRVIPIECGYVQIPKIKVFDKRRAAEGESEGEPIKVIDARVEHRTVTEDVVEGKGLIIAPVLVLP